MFPTFITIFLCSVLLTASVFILRGGKRLLDIEGAFYTVEAFLIDSAEKNREEIFDNLRREKWLDSITFISREEALRDFREKFPKEMLDLVEDNPLPASFRMRFKKRYRSPEILEEWMKILEQSGHFDAVQAPLSFAKIFSAWKFRLFFWPVVLSLVLLLTLSLILGNAVQLALYSRKLLVENMKYTGASRFFIEFPFILEGVVQGFLGSFAASLAVSFGLNALSEKFPFADTLFQGAFFPSFICVALVTILSAQASLRSVRKFLAGDRGADS